VDTVRWHLKHIYVKLHVHSRTEAALKFRGSS
jgi:DNA-binding CsgD family transcriptional regulator